MTTTNTERDYPALPPCPYGDTWSTEDIRAFHAYADPLMGKIAELEAQLKQRREQEPVAKLNVYGVPEWLPPTFGGSRSMGTKLYLAAGAAPEVRRETLSQRMEAAGFTARGFDCDEFGKKDMTDLQLQLHECALK